MIELSIDVSELLDHYKEGFVHVRVNGEKCVIAKDELSSSMRAILARLVKLE